MIRKILLSILAVSLIFIFLLEFFIFYNKGDFFIPFLANKLTPIPSPKPTTLTLEQFTSSPSAFATDEGVLKIQKELATLEEDLDNIDLEEVPLQLPIINLNIAF